ncbi:PAS domain-containing protein [Sphingobium boeckii]|uniref:histidine kinase n=1 Tax=Sphingobium boeckii TaxID=1082345 RepID=A0A7W9ED56_9SPHN|nr:PAS domain-containing protein [Sphingobium boeckii]MBB5684604.1 PAS domain S-box-containing protein [Sphingobium boeckii]
MSDILGEAFPGTSAMSAAMREKDWAATPLGAPEHWPDTLKIPLRMMLTSRFEMWLGWGADLAFFYNDAYAPTLGGKHPDALGRPVADVWKEIYADVKGRFDAVMHEGVSTWDEALLLFLERNGYVEETYHTFSYSPLKGAAGENAGLICVVSEETERVISERRLKLLSELSTALLPARTREAVMTALGTALRHNDRDFPFGMVRLFDDADFQASPPIGDGQDVTGYAWPLDRARAEKAGFVIALEGLSAEPLPKGAWDVAPREALVVPIIKTGQDMPAGALVLGINPYRRMDQATLDFAQLIAGQVAGALATADALRSEAAEMERLRDLFAQSPSFIAVLKGPDHRFEFVNPSYLQLIAHRDVIGLNVREGLPELEGQGFYELLDSAYETGESFVGQSMPITIQRTPDDEPALRLLDFVYQPMRDGDGNVIGMLVEGIDVTSAHDAVAALRESEAQFRTLAEAMANHVWTARPDGQLDWFNGRTLRYSGLDMNALSGPGWMRIVHPDDRDIAQEKWTDSIQTGQDYEAEFRIRNAEGVYRWHIARAVALKRDEGAISHWIGTNTDIDDQKSSAQALSELNATLEQQVVERTDRLMQAEEALRQSQKMEAVGQLTGGIAHDFNNLLAGIMGNLELLSLRISQGRLDAIPRHVDNAQEAAKRAAALTQRLLAFSRRQTLDPRPVNVNRLVGGMEDLIRRTVGPAIEIEVVGAGGIWPTLVDAYQLENALLNLCINARDAMPDGGRLTIETANKWLDDRSAQERDLPPGQYLSLCVTDTGTGMSRDVIERAFDPFFTTKPLGEGTGLGLSMIYGFARQSGGQVRIYSEVGEGTTMCLYLPRHMGEMPEVEPGASSASLPAMAHGETVLVVDDEASVRGLVTEILKDAGYHVLEADDGPSGLKLLQSNMRIDLLITDVGLPGGMNGRQVADAGRQFRPDLKILFITGYAENAALRNGHLGHGMEVVTKPFAIETLSNKIRDMIDR